MSAEPNHASYPWPPGAATGVGSLPGTDIAEATRVVFGELPDLPHLPELPARGPGADLVGRTAGLLVDLHVDLQPSGWRLVDRAGLDERRASSFLRRDLDALEEAAQGYAGPLKLQLAGPLTLAASVEMTRGGKALGDPGARRDLAASLAEAAAGHAEEVRRRLPDATVMVQLDEPSLPVVLAGRVPTASGYDVLPAVPAAEAEEALGQVVAAAGAPVVIHCCAAKAPFDLLRRAGAAAVSVDLALLETETGRGDDDKAAEPLGELVEAGIGLLLGVVPAVAPGGGDPELSDLADTVGAARRLWRRLGFPAERLAEVVVLTPACGLAGSSPAYARAALARCREAGRRLREGG